MNKLSNVFRPFNLEPPSKFNLNLLKKSDKTSKGYQFLINYGLIRRSSQGMYHLLPMGYRSIQKLIHLIDQHMFSVGAQKVCLAHLTPLSLWKKTGTYESAKEDLYEITDRNQSRFILSPTYEEAFTELLTYDQISYKNLPIKLYQVTSKFRDELRPRLGLLRSREFIMKDLYTFDADQESALKTYEMIGKAYEKCFQTLDKSESNPDLITSHEYYFVCDQGDDNVYVCHKCKAIFPEDVYKDRHLCKSCCLNLDEIGFTKAVEIAHTFNFGTKYSDRIKCNFMDKNGKETALHMCSYGIGISRLLAATAEVLSLEHELRLPAVMAPYTVCVIPPKGGSREEVRVELVLPELYSLLESIPNLKNDIVIDDRLEQTIGKRLLEAKAFGFPFIIVAGKDATKNTPLFELYDIYNDKKFLMPKSTLLQYLIDNTKYLKEENIKLAYLSDLH